MTVDSYKFQKVAAACPGLLIQNFEGFGDGNNSVKNQYIRQISADIFPVLLPKTGVFVQPAYLHFRKSKQRNVLIVVPVEIYILDGRFSHVFYRAYFWRLIFCDVERLTLKNPGIVRIINKLEPVAFFKQHILHSCLQIAGKPCITIGYLKYGRSIFLEVHGPQMFYAEYTATRSPVSADGDSSRYRPIR